MNADRQGNPGRSTSTASAGSIEVGDIQGPNNSAGTPLTALALRDDIRRERGSSVSAGHGINPSTNGTGNRTQRQSVEDSIRSPQANEYDAGITAHSDRRSGYDSASIDGKRRESGDSDSSIGQEQPRSNHIVSSLASRAGGLNPTDTARLMPPEPPVKKRGRKPRKFVDSGQEPSKDTLFEIPFLTEVKVLTASEIRGLRDGLIEALNVVWEYSDKGISTSNKNNTEAYIWQTMTDEETAYIADWFLARGQGNKVSAQFVRSIVEAHRQLKIGFILLPKFLETWRFYTSNGGLSV
jgi:hypothetical protein